MDWKITCTFYTALRLLRAFCIKRKVNPGRTHDDVARSLNLRRCSGGKTITQFPQHVWDWYEALQRYSEQARYDGMLDPDVEKEVQKENFEHCRELLNKLMAYFSKNGIECDYKNAA